MRWEKPLAESLQPLGYIVNLLREVEQFLRAAELAPTRFGREAVGDPRFVFDLRNGREPRPQTIARIRTYLEAGR